VYDPLLGSSLVSTHQLHASQELSYKIVIFAGFVGDDFHRAAWRSDLLLSFLS
jgi:hypothetical protein